LDSVLDRGIRYYRYIYYCNINSFFKFMNFLNETFYYMIQSNTIHKYLRTKKKFLVSYSDLSIFTNYKLSNNLYLNSVHDKMYIRMNSKNIDLNVYLNCLKI